MSDDEGYGSPLYPESDEGYGSPLYPESDDDYESPPESVDESPFYPDSDDDDIKYSKNKGKKSVIFKEREDDWRYSLPDQDDDEPSYYVRETSFSPTDLYEEQPDYGRIKELEYLIDNERKNYNIIESRLNEAREAYSKAKKEEGEGKYLSPEYKQEMNDIYNDLNDMLSASRDKYEEYLEEYEQLGGNKLFSDPSSFEKEILSYKKSNIERYIDDLIKERKELDRGIKKLEYLLNNQKVDNQLSDDQIETIQKQIFEMNKRLENNREKYFNALNQREFEKQEENVIKSLVINPLIKFNNKIHNTDHFIHPNKNKKLKNVIENYINDLGKKDLQQVLDKENFRYVPKVYNLTILTPSKSPIFFEKDLTLEENTMTKGVYKMIFDYDADPGMFKVDRLKDNITLDKALEIYFSKESEKYDKVKDPRKVAFKNVKLTIQSEVDDVLIKRRDDITVSRQETINDAIQNFFINYFDVFINTPYNIVILDSDRKVIRHEIFMNKTFFENDLLDDYYMIVLRYYPEPYKRKMAELRMTDRIDKKMPKQITITDDTNTEPESITYDVVSSDIVSDVLNRYVSDKPVSEPVRLVEFFEGKSDNKKNRIIVENLDKTYFDNKLNANNYYVKLYYFIDHEQKIELGVANEENEKQNIFIYTVNLDTILIDVVLDYIYQKLEYPSDVEINNFNYEMRDKLGNTINIVNIDGTMADNELFFKEYKMTIFPDYKMISNILELDKGFESLDLSGIDVSDIQPEPDEYPQIEMAESDDDDVESFVF